MMEKGIVLLNTGLRTFATSAMEILISLIQYVKACQSNDNLLRANFSFLQEMIEKATSQEWPKALENFAPSYFG